MIGRAMKKLIIVCDEKTEQYANYLRQLISTNDDKDGEVVGVADGTVEAAVWLERDYMANKATVSSNEHILFVGDNNTSKSESSSMIVKYDKFGMKYGWLGKRAMMKVDNDMLSSDAYDEFINYCLGYQLAFEKIAINNSESTEVLPEKENVEKTTENVETPATVVTDVVENKEPEKKKFDLGTLRDAGRAAGAGLGATIAAIAGAFNEIGKNIEKTKIHNKIMDQQYRALSVILYIDGLQQFLEG